MVIIISIIVIVAIIAIAFYLNKIVKEEKEYFKEEKLAMEEEERNNPQPQPQSITNKKAIVIKDEEFEKMLLEAKNDSLKIDNLKRVIQDNLRSCIKFKDMEGSRKCNAQLKQISLIEKEGTQD